MSPGSLLPTTQQMSRLASFKDPFLLQACVSPKTWSSYQRALSEFIAFCRQESLFFANSRELDLSLQYFITELFLCGGSRQTGVNAVAATLLMHPHCRCQLPRARSCLRGWLRLRPSVSWPPISWELTALVVVHFLKTGRPRVAFAILLTFDCLLRGGELTSLRRSDIAVPNDPRLGGSSRSSYALHLRKTKTGKNMWVEVRTPILGYLFKYFLRGRGNSLLFPFSLPQLRRWFREACTAVSCRTKFTLHSLRHGGATYLHLARVPIEDIMYRGRWASNKSCRRYIQAGRALLLQMKEASPVSFLANYFSVRLGHTFEMYFSALREGGN